MAPHVITLKGELTLATADATRAALLAGLGEGRALAIDCSAADECDVTLVQLLLAARRSAHERNLSFALCEPVPAALVDVLNRGGFLPADGSAGALFRTAGDGR